MTKIKILFVCKMNRDRSRTAEEIYQNHPQLEVKSAGIAWNAIQRVTPELLTWATVILCMEESHQRHIEIYFEKFIAGKVIDYLDIEANYAHLLPNPRIYMKEKVDAWLLDYFPGFLPLPLPPAPSPSFPKEGDW